MSARAVAIGIVVGGIVSFFAFIAFVQLVGGWLVGVGQGG